MERRDKLRDEIDEIDGQLMELLNRRISLAVEIAKIKAREGIPLVDPERERTVIDRLCASNDGPLPPDSVARIFRLIIREARLAQSKAVK